MSVLRSTFDTEMDLYLDEHGEMYEPTPLDTGDEGASLTTEEPTTTTASAAPTGDLTILTSIDGEPMPESAGPVEFQPTETVAQADEPAFDPAVAEAEALAATGDTFDDTELADARQSEPEIGAQTETETSETAFGGSDWISSLAQAEIGAAAETAEANTEPVNAATEPDAKPATPAAPAIAFDSEARTFDVNVQDAPLPGLLRDLSSQARRSIIVSPDVAGTVSASLYGLSLEETLDAVLPSQGLGYVEEGKVIRVLPLETIAARVAAETAAQKAAIAAAEKSAALAAAQTEVESTASAAQSQPLTDLEVVDRGSTTSVNAPLSISSGQAESDAGSAPQTNASATTSTTEAKPTFDESSPIEAQIDETLGDALLGALSFTEFQWSPTVTRDGFNEPTTWNNSTSSEAGSTGTSAEATTVAQAVEEEPFPTSDIDDSGSENPDQD
jgi:hypothetical protein